MGSGTRPHAKPLHHLLFIGAAPENDASDLFAAVGTARHVHNFETILGPVQTFDLPDIGLDIGIGSCSNAVTISKGRKSKS